MKKTFKRLTFVLSLALVASMAVAAPAFAATLPMTTSLTKTLHMNDGVTVPADMVFTFNFAKEGGLTALTIPNQTITIPANATNGTTGALAATQTLNLTTVLNGLLTTPGLHAGPQDWIVTEVVPGTPIADVTYDTSSFRLRVHFANLAAGGLEIASVEVFRIVPPVPPETNPTFDKTNYFVFNNIFNPNVGDSANPALRITKTIAGDRAEANLLTLFPFTVTLTAPGVLGIEPDPNPAGPVVTPVLPAPLVGTIVNATTGNPVTGADLAPRTTNEVTFTAGVASFELRDGERLNIPTLPGGTTYTVLETGTANFRPEAIVTQGGVAGPVLPATPADFGDDLTVDGTVHNVPTPPANIAAFTNFYNAETPAGLFIANNAALIISALAATALVLLLASRSRKRIEQMPTV